MAFFRKRVFEHDWLPDSGVLEADAVLLVTVTPKLAVGYLRLFEGDFKDIHHWPQSMIDDLDRGLRHGADQKIRHLLTKHKALLVLPEDHSEVVGFVSLAELEVGNEPLQLGFQVHPRFRGQGFVSTLLPVLADHLEMAGYVDVAISTSEENAAMTRVCEKLGCPYTKIQYRHPNGDVETVRQYTLLPR